jgi:DNA repair exonuclease SbcCD ATPase subunit
MYTAEQISELIQALRKCKEAACNSCKYECCQDITVDAADALTAITAENEALTHERDKLSKLLKAECAILNSHNDTIARLQAELAAQGERSCENCGNTPCANSHYAYNWDECVSSDFTKHWTPKPRKR